MKRIYKTGLLFCTLITIVFLNACTTPETPPNNAEDRGHEDPNVTTYSFIPGKLEQLDITGKDGKNRPYLADGFSPIEGAKTQNIQFYTDENGDLRREGKLTIHPDQWYRVTINFINKSGTNINYQYVEDDHARAKHQFFYRTFYYNSIQNNINQLKDVQFGENNPVDFRYGDKFSDGSLIDSPIGFVGYMRVNGDKIKKHGINKFVLNPVLVHVMGPSKLNPRTKEPFPFDRPGEEILGVTDIDHRFEVNIVQ